mmetsp:Transcript_18684/g.32444  ORF Transcript_18684/g.32444 Transcript_18684/m.32444 type:complete len:276 (+) Transcript_18684:244-1071(+)|eukprot:CAMPEP_0184705078 /NCGR_PEP_ID=MMETSP0313-20130426/33229_1 /TAXON_ID=2792 /ORGANISM="Porphyridium aerugineum, Strain SAG 1380-2" /LENGTH=275 /DNA_ID=CAMNT_0027166341 /DNA_START=209 /DNA_END=1036 /DNA_ORIENTATION=-
MASKNQTEGIDLRNILLTILDTLGRLIHKCEDLGTDMTIVKSEVTRTNQTVQKLLKKRKLELEKSSSESQEKYESAVESRRSKQHRVLREDEETATTRKQLNHDKDALQEQRKAFREVYEQNWELIRRRFPKLAFDKSVIEVPTLVFVKLKGWPFWPALIICNCDQLPAPVLLLYVKAKKATKKDGFLPIKFFNAAQNEEYAFTDIFDEASVKCFELNQHMYNVDELKSGNSRNGSKLKIAISQAIAFYKTRLEEKRKAQERRTQMKQNSCLHTS